MELASLKLLVPEIILLVTASLALLLGLGRSDGVRKLAQVAAALGLLLAFVVTLLSSAGALPQEWIQDAMMTGRHTRVTLFSGNFLTLLACAIGFLCVLAAWDSPFKNDPSAPDSRFRGEFFAMMLFSLAGVSLVGKVNDLVWLFIVLELVSIPTYILVSVGRGQIVAQEAGVKYFFLGALAAAVYLFGFSYLYGYAGSTRFDAIHAQFVLDLAAHRLPTLALVGLLLVLVGISYKIAAVPLHFYTPDVYQGAATPVTAFLAFAPKAAGIVAIVSILSLTGYQFTTWDAGAGQWVVNGALGQALITLLSVMAILTMTIGNVLALLQRNLKRMLAYSSIAHSGYMLVGLVAGPGDPLSNAASTNGVSAALFYLCGYSLMNLGAFAVLIYFQGKADAGEDLDDLAGVSKEHPIAALAMAICLLSLIGMPLTIGFLGKLYIIEAALANGHRALAVITVINAAIAAAYYLRVIAAMYLREAWNPASVRESTGPRASAAVCTIAVVLFFVVPAPLFYAINPAFFAGSTAAQTEPGPAAGRALAGAAGAAR